MTEFSFQDARASLVIAHSGHELRVHHWLETVHPVTFVLTKGDGAHGVSRLASTTTILDGAGCRRGPIYGRLDDRQIYRALLDGNVTLFEGLVDELVGESLALDIDYLVADAEEGYNPSHDVCRYVAAAAALATSRARGRPLRDFDFPLIAGPDTCP